MKLTQQSWWKNNPPWHPLLLLIPGHDPANRNLLRIEWEDLEDGSQNCLPRWRCWDVHWERVTRMDRIKDEQIRGTVKVEERGDRVREERLRWFGEYIWQRMLEMELTSKRRGRPQRRSTIQDNVEMVSVRQEEETIYTVYIYILGRSTGQWICTLWPLCLHLNDATCYVIITSGTFALNSSSHISLSLALSWFYSFSFTCRFSWGYCSCYFCFVKTCTFRTSCPSSITVHLFSRLTLWVMSRCAEYTGPQTAIRMKR